MDIKEKVTALDGLFKECDRLEQLEKDVKKFSGYYVKKFTITAERSGKTESVVIEDVIFNEDIDEIKDLIVSKINERSIRLKSYIKDVSDNLKEIL